MTAKQFVQRVRKRVDTIKYEKHHHHYAEIKECETLLKMVELVLETTPQFFKLNEELDKIAGHHKALPKALPRGTGSGWGKYFYIDSRNKTFIR